MRVEWRPRLELQRHDRMEIQVTAVLLLLLLRALMAHMHLHAYIGPRFHPPHVTVDRLFRGNYTLHTHFNIAGPACIRIDCACTPCRAAYTLIIEDHLPVAHACLDDKGRETQQLVRSYIVRDAGRVAVDRPLCDGFRDEVGDLLERRLSLV